MTKLRDDVMRQPGNLRRILGRLTGPARKDLDRAIGIVRDAKHVYVSGIGSSWHAGMAVTSFLDEAGRPAALVDSSEFVHYVGVARDAAVILLSRSGKSVEIVEMVGKARAAGAKVVGITNTPDSPLAKGADPPLLLDAPFDHMVSVTMFSGLGLAGSLVTAGAAGGLGEGLFAGLDRALAEAERALDGWGKRIEGSGWLEPGMRAYFLARGAGQASAYESRLIWEEAAKTTATVLNTGGFRHGPLEVVGKGLAVGLWLDAERQRENDLELARDMRGHGVRVMLVGQRVPEDAGLCVCNLPEIAPRWQFLVDPMPMQLAGEALARLRGVDGDSFRHCPYIIEKEGGMKGA